MDKLDNLFKFRDNEKFKKFNKVFSFIVLACFLALIMIVIYFGGTKEGKNQTRPYVFSILPLFLLLSFFRKNDYLFILAEFITIIADIFLILLGNIDVGFPIYLIVQLIYGAYFYFRDENKRRKLIVLIFRGSLMLIATIIMIIIKKTSVKFIFGGMYFVNILINVVYASIFKDPILIIGFIIFAISDTFIALGILFSKNETMMTFLSKFNFVYFTYLISQIILIFNTSNNKYCLNSAKENNSLNKENK